MEYLKFLETRNGILLIFTAFALVFLTLTNGVCADFAGGDGTEESPYKIGNWYHLDSVRYNLDSNFELVDDLDKTSDGYQELAGEDANDGKGWNPIGGTYKRFGGTLYGRGHVIRDFYIDRPDDENVGLFSYTDDDGSLEEIGLENFDVVGSSEVGGLVGMNRCEISESYASGRVRGEGDFVGGLVGLSSGLVSNSYASGTVRGEGDYIGGLIGGNTGTIIHSYSYSQVQGGGQIGGLVGGNRGEIDGSFWDISASGVEESDGGTGETMEDMKNFLTFDEAGWEITVVEPGDVDQEFTWNIISDDGYPFLSFSGYEDEGFSGFSGTGDGIPWLWISFFVVLVVVIIVFATFFFKGRSVERGHSGDFSENNAEGTGAKLDRRTGGSVPPEIEEWIEKNLDRGYSRQQMRDLLESSGRDPGLIDRYFEER